MSQEDRKKRHAKLQGRLNELREERSEYEDTETTGGKQTQEGSREEVERIDKEMTEVRKEQREIYEEYRKNRNSP